jgi:hypothetical protein
MYRMLLSRQYHPPSAAPSLSHEAGSGVPIAAASGVELTLTLRLACKAATFQ